MFVTSIRRHSIQCCRNMVFSVLVVVFFYRLSLFVHNVLNQDNVSVLPDCFYKTTHHYSLRHTQRLHVVVPKRACDDLNFFIFGPEFINFLYIDTIYYTFTDFKYFLLSNFNYLYQIFHNHFCFFTF